MWRYDKKQPGFSGCFLLLNNPQLQQNPFKPESDPFGSKALTFISRIVYIRPATHHELEGDGNYDEIQNNSVCLIYYWKKRYEVELTSVKTFSFVFGLGIPYYCCVNYFRDTRGRFCCVITLF